MHTTRSIFESLERDHKKIRELFIRLAQCANAPDVAAKYHARLRDVLINHSVLEEEILYPELETFQNTREEARLSICEHDQIRDLLDQWDRLGRGGKPWVMKFREIRQLMERHMTEEETIIFPKMQRLFTLTELAEMGQAVAKVQQQLSASVA